MGGKGIYRKCPYCNKSLARCFSRHLLEVHNKSKLDYILFINNIASIDDLPKCAYSKCKNKVGINYNNYELRTYCNENYHSCELLHKAELGLHHYQSQNRLKNPDGSDVLMSKVVAEGKCHLSSFNRVYNESGVDEMAKKAAETRVKLGINAFSKSNLIYDDEGSSNIHKASMNSKLLTGKFTGNGIGDSNKDCILYIGIYKKECRLKLGRTSNLNKRLQCYKSAGIESDKLITYSSTEDIIFNLETKLSDKYNTYRSILDKNKYPNPSNSYMTIGHTEWYNIKILDDLKLDIETELTNQ